MSAIVTIRINFPENDLNYGWVFDRAKTLECFIHNSLAKECVNHGHGATQFSVTSETVAIAPYKETDVQSITGTGSNAAPILES